MFLRLPAFPWKQTWITLEVGMHYSGWMWYLLGGTSSHQENTKMGMGEQAVFWNSQPKPQD